MFEIARELERDMGGSWQVKLRYRSKCFIDVPFMAWRRVIQQHIMSVKLNTSLWPPCLHEHDGSRMVQGPQGHQGHQGHHDQMPPSVTLVLTSMSEGPIFVLEFSQATHTNTLTQTHTHKHTNTHTPFYCMQITIILWAPFL